jgi:hypothetical protein
MTFAQRRNRLTTHFSERIPVVKGRIPVHARYVKTPANSRDQDADPVLLTAVFRINIPA